MTPDGGQIVLDGRVLFDSAAGIDLPPQRRQVGYLFQQYALFPNMTVRQNIVAACGTRPRRQGRRCRRSFHRSGWRPWQTRSPASSPADSSSGCALARILASEPTAILLDEPFSALDSYLKWQLGAGAGRFSGRIPGHDAVGVP